MIKASVKIEGQRRLEEMIPRAKEALKAAFVEVARELVEEQSQLIERESKPDGSKQEPVTKRTFFIKRAEGVRPNVPLYRTGRLANAGNWRIRKTKVGASVRPPADRDVALHVLRARGFRTVFDTLPEKITKRLAERVDRAIGAILK
jgi:hypothetical protein